MIATHDLVTVGRSELRTPPLGVGVWAWGERGFWGYGGAYTYDDVAAAFVTSINAGLTFFDTAEVYGNGESERILGELVRKNRQPAIIASKFAPLPWRLTPRALLTALDGSLRRLGVEQIDLYQIHWPYTLLSPAGLMDVLAEAVAEGKVRAVGVSNYSAEQMRRAAEMLARRGVALASNQVHYSLLHRAPEVNGVADACRELGVTLIAYSPLAQGLLTGKYSRSQRPGGPRQFIGMFSAANLRDIEPLIALLREIGQGHDGKSPGRVALNWLIAQGNVLPIPGAKNARQATANAGTLGWSLSAAEITAIDQASQTWRR